MAADIYLDMERLKGEIIRINDRKILEFDRAMRSASSAIASLTAYGWSGEAKEAFLREFAKYKIAMRAVQEDIKEFNQQLKTIHKDGKKLIDQGSKAAAKL